MQKIAVTIPEAQEMSGLGRTTLYEIFKKGSLKPRKQGKRTLILVSELENYINNLPVAK
ncbi:MAG: helix-turn-helix domain-containing protein [Pseudomonadota bacterium]